ncbi:MAG: hypothetical protein ABI724_03635 [Betaproteobacteria bacterium]
MQLADRRLELLRASVDEVLVHHVVADDHRDAVEVGFLGSGLNFGQDRPLLRGHRLRAKRERQQDGNDNKPQRHRFQEVTPQVLVSRGPDRPQFLRLRTHDW